MTRDGAPTSKWPAHLAGEPAEGPGPGRASLVVRRPGLPEVTVPVTSGLVIGRAPALADLVLDDELVSREHARLHVDPRGYYRLEDLGSRNGIRFADRTVRRLNLVDGDVFHIGRTELVFSAEMTRLAAFEAEPPPRVDTIMVDAAVAVPEPQPEPDDGLEGIEQLAWRGAPRSKPAASESSRSAPAEGNGDEG